MRTLTAFVTACFMVSSGSAEIIEWTPKQLGTDYTTSGTNPINITILTAGTFKFESVTGGNLDTIGSITISGSLTSGTVTVHIERDPNEVGNVPGLPGATSVGSIDLTTSGVIGELEFLHITGSLGTSAAIDVSAITGNIIVGDATGTDELQNVLSAGTVNGDITIADNVSNTTGALNLGVFEGNLTIGGNMSGTVTATSVTGNIEVGGNAPGSADVFDVGAMTGDFTIDGLNGAIVATSLDGDITIGAGGGGTITIQSTYSDKIEVQGGSFLGDILISNGVTAGTPGLGAGGIITASVGFFGVNSSIIIEGDLDGEISAPLAGGDMLGVVEVGGNLSSNLVAEVNFHSGHKFAGTEMTALEGAFYVTD